MLETKYTTYTIRYVPRLARYGAQTLRLDFSCQVGGHIKKNEGL